MAYKYILPETIKKIVDMTVEGCSVDEIMIRTGVSQSTIKRVRQHYNVKNDLPEYVRVDVWQWLNKNWHFKIPEKKPVKRKSNFRTPYNTGRR